MTKPHVLISNDDGYLSEGIQCLASVFSEFASVTVVAPETEQSGVGRHITLRRPLRARSLDGFSGPAYAVDGTPTDCVYLALYGLLDAPPDLVVSGINCGPNLAQDVGYSGTVAAACEGASIGVPSMAVSLDYGSTMDYSPGANFAAAVAQMMLSCAWSSETVLNVNLPNTAGRAITGFRWTRSGVREYFRQVTRREDAQGVPYYWLGGRRLGFDSREGSDCDTVAAGIASITPLTMETTNLQCLEEQKAIGLKGFKLV